MVLKQRKKRSTLSKAEARQHFIGIGEQVVLQQIQNDARTLDRRPVAVGPFARLDAGAVAAYDGKTRGAVTNVFKSQSAFQAETMGLALNAAHWLDQVEYPLAADFPTAGEWVDAFFAGQSARGPKHRSKPVVNYASLWVLWLSAVPYGLWSERVSKPSIAEQVGWVKQLEIVFQGALDHFQISMRPTVTVNDLASAVASMVEGVWLNQCLTESHPSDALQPVSELMCRSGRILWQGAVETVVPVSYSPRPATQNEHPASFPK